MGSYDTLDGLDRKTQKGVDAALFQGEDFLGAIDVYDSMIGRRRTKLVLTDRRVLEFKRGFIRQSTNDYDRDNITNVSFDKGIIYRKLGISGSGFAETWYVDYENGQQFATAVRNSDGQRVVQSAGETSSSTETVDAASATGTAGAGTARPAVESADESSGAVSGSTKLPLAGSVPPRDNYHYGAIGGIILALLGSAVNVSGLVLLGVFAAALLIYCDIIHVSRTSNWRPNALLYTLGTIFLFFVALPVYLYRRHKAIGL